MVGISPAISYFPFQITYIQTSMKKLLKIGCQYILVWWSKILLLRENLLEAAKEIFSSLCLEEDNPANWVVFHFRLLNIFDRIPYNSWVLEKSPVD